MKGNDCHVDGWGLQSAVIDWLRLPMAVAVVYIHSFGVPEVDMARLHGDPWCMHSLYDFVRIALSNVAMGFAVPVFFMISGYLFFYKAGEWNARVYADKLRKRFRSLAVPYLLWILIYVLWMEAWRLGGVLLHGKPLSGLWEYILDKGGWRMLWDSASWGANYLDVFGNPAPMTSPVLVPLWFVRDLMVVVLFTPVLHWLVKRFRFAPVLFFGVCYVCRVFIPVHGFSATSFFFFSLGACFSIHGMDMVASLRRWRLPAYGVAVLCLPVLVWVNGRKGDGVVPQPQWVDFLYYAYVLAAVVSVVGMASWLVGERGVRVNRWLGRSAFFVFLSHVMVLGLMGRFTHHFLPAERWGLMTAEYVLRPLVTVALCLVLYWLMGRFAPRLLALLTGGRVR